MNSFNLCYHHSSWNNLQQVHFLSILEQAINIKGSSGPALWLKVLKVYFLVTSIWLWTKSCQTKQIQHGDLQTDIQPLCLLLRQKGVSDTDPASEAAQTSFCTKKKSSTIWKNFQAFHTLNSFILVLLFCKIANIEACFSVNHSLFYLPPNSVGFFW